MQSCNWHVNFKKTHVARGWFFSLIEIWPTINNKFLLEILQKFYVSIVNVSEWAGAENENHPVASQGESVTIFKQQACRTLLCLEVELNCSALLLIEVERCIENFSGLNQLCCCQKLITHSYRKFWLHKVAENFQLHHEQIL